MDGPKRKLSPATAGVVLALLNADPRELYGLEIAETARVATGSLYPILATLPDTKQTKREQLTALITGGFSETVRITKPKGIILAKAGQGTDGAKVYASDRLMLDLARQHKLEIMWELVFPTVPRSQKHRGPQQSPRCNYSKLFVLRKVK